MVIAEELIKSDRLFSIPFGKGKKLVYRVSDVIENDFKIAMLNVESVESDLKKLDFANIFELRSYEHVKVFEILLADLGESLAESLWGLRTRRNVTDDEDKWYHALIRILKRGKDHGDGHGPSKKIMGKVLKYPVTLGRQVSIERLGKDIKLVVSKVDKEGKVVKTGVVASANKEQHEMVKSKLSSPIKGALSPVIDKIWKSSDKFTKAELESHSWPMPKRGPPGWQKKWRQNWSPNTGSPKKSRFESEL